MTVPAIGIILRIFFANEIFDQAFQNKGVWKKLPPMSGGAMGRSIPFFGSSHSSNPLG
jgi:hypothetical protein